MASSGCRRLTDTAPRSVKRQRIQVLHAVNADHSFPVPVSSAWVPYDTSLRADFRDIKEVVQTLLTLSGVLTWDNGIQALRALNEKELVPESCLWLTELFVHLRSCPLCHGNGAS